MTLLDCDAPPLADAADGAHARTGGPEPSERAARILEKLTTRRPSRPSSTPSTRAPSASASTAARASSRCCDTMLEDGGELGVEEVVIGMAHRGRLNVLTNILGKSPDQIFSEFDGPEDPRAVPGPRRREVPHGLLVRLSPPSREEHPPEPGLQPQPPRVRAPGGRGPRARQAGAAGGAGPASKVLPLVIHGDAAMAGQGVVAETLNLSRLRGYDTGGTVHIVINNQLGYTTDPEDGAARIYCTAVAQMLDIPIFHVNGDDPEACVHVMRLATEYRQRFQSDVVVDLVCFRRYGHNEGDEPSYTQPLMYELIRSHPTVPTLYAQDARRAGPPQRRRRRRRSATQAKRHFLERLHPGQGDAELTRAERPEGLWKNYRGGPDEEASARSTPASRRSAGSRCSSTSRSVPEGFTPLRQMGKILERRRAMADGEHRCWTGRARRALAYATLLTGRLPRPAHRPGHRARHLRPPPRRAARREDRRDLRAARRISGRARRRFAVYNSPLSETGCMGFEFGYSLDYPDALVALGGAVRRLRQRRPGDHRPVHRRRRGQVEAAVRADAAACRTATKARGPEHSSARLERFLELSAEDNIQVCYPTTPAQIFHLLRRQVLRPWRKPLVVMTPKSLLRRAEAASPLSALHRGRVPAPHRRRAGGRPEGVTRLLLCTRQGLLRPARRSAPRPGSTPSRIARVEQLYPFPAPELDAAARSGSRLSRSCSGCRKSRRTWAPGASPSRC